MHYDSNSCIGYILVVTDIFEYLETCSSFPSGFDGLLCLYQLVVGGAEMPSNVYIEPYHRQPLSMLQ